MSARSEKQWIEILHKRHPELADECVRVISTGYQNMVLVIGEKWIFRFPRSEDTASLELEMKLLPKLKNRLPASVPDYVYRSKRKDPHPYVGYPLLEGEPLERATFAGCSKETQARLAKQIADFLTQLHTFNGDTYVEVDKRELQATWRRNWGGYYRAVEEQIFPHIPSKERIWIMEVFYEYLSPSDNFKFTPSLIHGDFKNDHLLVDRQKGRLTGVIDFSSMKVGDPSYDYHDLYLTYGEAFTNLVYKLYRGPKDATFLPRCKYFYTYIIRFSSMMNAIHSKDTKKLELRMEWLRSMARGGDFISW